MKIEIGAYEAKTRLPELLREVQAGKQFTITNRGRAVADLVPSGAGRGGNAAAAIEQYLAYMREHPPRGKTDIKGLIEEGRE